MFVTVNHTQKRTDVGKLYLPKEIAGGGGEVGIVDDVTANGGNCANFTLSSVNPTGTAFNTSGDPSSRIVVSFHNGSVVSNHLHQCTHSGNPSYKKRKHHANHR
jgi:hypothetical protein